MSSSKPGKKTIYGHFGRDGRINVTDDPARGIKMVTELIPKKSESTVMTVETVLNAFQQTLQKQADGYAKTAQNLNRRLERPANYIDESQYHNEQARVRNNQMEADRLYKIIIDIREGLDALKQERTPAQAFWDGVKTCQQSLSARMEDLQNSLEKNPSMASIFQGQIATIQASLTALSELKNRQQPRITT